MNARFIRAVAARVLIPAFVAVSVATIAPSAALGAELAQTPSYTCDRVDWNPGNGSAAGAGRCAVTEGSLPPSGPVFGDFVIHDRRGGGGNPVYCEASATGPAGWANLPNSIRGENCTPIDE